MCGEAEGLKALGLSSPELIHPSGVFTLPTGRARLRARGRGPGPRVGWEVKQEREDSVGGGGAPAWIGRTRQLASSLPALVASPVDSGLSRCVRCSRNSWHLSPAGPPQGAGNVCFLSGRQMALWPTSCEEGQPGLFLGSWGRA